MRPTRVYVNPERRVMEAWGIDTYYARAQYRADAGLDRVEMPVYARFPFCGGKK
jgi:hypothetical protein